MVLFDNESRKIPLDEANRIIEKRANLYVRTARLVSEILRFVRGNQEIINHFDHPGNSYLFTRKSVLRHFFEDENFTILKKDVSHLRVILGAHEKDDRNSNFKTGDPTICITGANQESSTQINGRTEFTFKVVTEGEEPFDEHPPIETVVSGNKFVNEDDRTFKVIL